MKTQYDRFKPTMDRLQTLFGKARTAVSKPQMPTMASNRQASPSPLSLDVTTLTSFDDLLRDANTQDPDLPARTVPWDLPSAVDTASTASAIPSADIAAEAAMSRYLPAYLLSSAETTPTPTPTPSPVSYDLPIRLAGNTGERYYNRERYTMRHARAAVERDNYEKLTRRLQTMPQELQDLIFDFVVGLGDLPLEVIIKRVQPFNELPWQLTIERNSRRGKELAISYYSTSQFFVQTLCHQASEPLDQWLQELSLENRQAITSVRLRGCYACDRVLDDLGLDRGLNWHASCLEHAERRLGEAGFGLTNDVLCVQIRLKMDEKGSITRYDKGQVLRAKDIRKIEQQALQNLWST